MNHHTVRATMFVAAMLAASASFAGADIVKCVDKDGHVTLTDSQCGEGEGEVIVAGAAEAPAADADVIAAPATPATPAAPAVRRLTAERSALPPASLRQSSWSAPRPASRQLARDVETLKAARLSMQVLDQTSAAMKHQRLAGLN